MAVDVLLPFHGDVRLLRLAVESVLAQDDDDWRLTLVDDASDVGGLARWIEGLGDERVRYLRNSGNLGAPGNYRRCLELVEHDFVVVMGADDLMLPWYIRTVKHVLAQHPRAAVLQPGVGVVDLDGIERVSMVDSAKRFLRRGAVHHGERDGSRVELQGEPLAVSLLHGNWTYFPSLCWRADFLTPQRIRTDLDVLADFAVLLDLTTSGRTLVCDPRPAFLYRRHQLSDSSVRARRGSRFTEERAFYGEAAERYANLGWRRAARAARLHLSSRAHAAWQIGAAVRCHDVSATPRLLRHALGT